jgi:hypothetical protein
VGIRDGLRRLEHATEGERMVLVCPECGEEFTLYGDPALEFIAHQWAQGYQGELYGPPTDPAAAEMAEHEHDAYEFIDKATSEKWLKDLLGAEGWEAANGA